ILQLAALNDVTSQMMIMSISRERQVGNDGAEMQHRCELNSELARRMHGNTELKRFANGGCFHARANAAPKRRVKQHHVDRRIQNISRQLFEIDYDSVRCERYAHLFTHAPHSVQTVNGIFQVIIANVFDLLSKPDCRLRGPGGVWIEAKAIALERRGERTIAFELVFRRKNPSF